MSLDTANEIWGELKRYISSVDRAEAAEILVGVLIDNDYDASDIRETFKGDSDIRIALQTHLDDGSDDQEEDDSDDDFDYDEDDY